MAWWTGAGKHDKAVEWGKSVLQAEDCPMLTALRVAEAMGDTEMSRRRWAEAISAFQLAVKAHGELTYLGEATNGISATALKAKLNRAKEQAKRELIGEPKASYEKALAFDRKGDAKRALPLYQWVIDNYPQHELAQASVCRDAHCQMVLEETQAARKRLETMIAEEPVGPWRSLAYLYLGDLFLEYEFDSERAMSQYQLSLDCNPTGDPSRGEALPAAHQRLGVCLFMLGKNEEAEKHFHEYLKLKPTQHFENQMLPNQIANLIEMCEKRQNPVYFADKVMQGDKRIGSLLFMASCALEAGNHEQAAGLFRRLDEPQFAQTISFKQKAYAQMELAESARMAGDSEKAERMLLEFETTYAWSASAPLALRERASLLFQARKRDQAMACLSMIVQRYPDSEYACEAMYNAAYAEYFAERWESAGRLFQQLIDRWPKSWHAKIARTQALPEIRAKLNKTTEGK